MGMVRHSTSLSRRPIGGRLPQQLMHTGWQATQVALDRKRKKDMKKLIALTRESRRELTRQRFCRKPADSHKMIVRKKSKIA